MISASPVRTVTPWRSSAATSSSGMIGVAGFEPRHAVQPGDVEEHSAGDGPLAPASLNRLVATGPSTTRQARVDWLDRLSHVRPRRADATGGVPQPG